MDSDRRSAQVERLEVIDTGRRRRWSENEKLKIVLESLQAPRQVAATARRDGVSRSLLLPWRRSFRPEPKDAAHQTGFAPAMVVAESEPMPSSRAGQQRRVDRDRVCRRGSDADHGYGRRGHAEGRRGGAGRWSPTVIPIGSGVRVWIATGHTDMRGGMNSLALLVQEAFTRDPHGGDLYVFRGKSGKLIKILWHDGLGMSTPSGWSAAASCGRRRLMAW
ncbi:IS66 family insertion sequence element accessory protein TnpB [Bradyrhizobium agreste]|uniref:IS66 family insertion sequence element accessory protein TnpB n=1 Tax=Bradyrhizobium agreste TaxID=2751811 RepID=UPI0024BF94B6